MGKIIVVEGSHCSGKSTTIQNMCKNYDYVESKSVPDWFRNYIPFARSLEADIQKKVYEIGHLAVYYNAINSDDNYVFDRWVYTTIIRLNYNKGVSVLDTAMEILEFKLCPNLVVFLEANVETIKNRRKMRDNILEIDYEFYEYENNIFRILSNYENFAIINNDRDNDETVKQIISLTKSFKRR